MNGVELYLLGRKLMTIGSDAMPDSSGLRRLSPSARLVLAGVFEYPGTPASEIAQRTGLPEDHVSASLSRLADDGLVEMAADPADGRRALARPAIRQLAGGAAPPVDRALAAAAGTGDAGQIADLVGMLESLSSRLGGVPAVPGTFNDSYRGTPPWDIGQPQAAFAELAEAGAIQGRVLDVGCGTGEHTLMAAGLGLPALGVDSAPAAIEIAERKARERDVPARFLVHDALALGDLGEQFDTVLDCGLFHVFDDQDRARFVDSLSGVVPARGRYFMLCFSDRQPPGFGPRRISQDEIRASFSKGWRVDAIDAATLEVNIDPAGVRAWRVALTRT